ncbi:unnamed protein product [Rhizophagus irregularis]|nr:unnamed protein product [Rhizophagus irregularis]CAB5378314.1 unnamed protein product [Rhizophagus irregularis]
MQHAELPVVENELSVSLWLKLKSHASDYTIIFHKGTDRSSRTPGLYLVPNTSKLHARFTGNWNSFNGEISNFRYFNWRLSAEEAMKNYLNSRPFN